MNDPASVAISAATGPITRPRLESMYLRSSFMQVEIVENVEALWGTETLDPKNSSLCMVHIVPYWLEQLESLKWTYFLHLSPWLHPTIYIPSCTRAWVSELTEMAGTVHQLVELEVWQSLQNLHSWEVRADGYAAVEITFLVAARCCSFHLIYLSKTLCATTLVGPSII